MGNCAASHASKDLFSNQLAPLVDACRGPQGLRYVGCAAGWTHTVLLRDDGEVVAVGGNGRGQLLALPRISNAVIICYYQLLYLLSYVIILLGIIGTTL